MPVSRAGQPAVGDRAEPLVCAWRIEARGLAPSYQKGRAVGTAGGSWLLFAFERRAGSLKAVTGLWTLAGRIPGAWCIAAMKKPLTITELVRVGHSARRSSFGRARMAAHSSRDPICIGGDDADPPTMLIDEGVSGEIIVDL
jgi:hypothetical protein